MGHVENDSSLNSSVPVNFDTVEDLASFLNGDDASPNFELEPLFPDVQISSSDDFINEENEPPFVAANSASFQNSIESMFQIPKESFVSGIADKVKLSKRGCTQKEKEKDITQNDTPVKKKEYSKKNHTKKRGRKQANENKKENSDANTYIDNNNSKNFDDNLECKPPADKNIRLKIKIGKNNNYSISQPEANCQSFEILNPKRETNDCLLSRSTITSNSLHPSYYNDHSIHSSNEEKFKFLSECSHEENGVVYEDIECSTPELELEVKKENDPEENQLPHCIPVPDKQIESVAQKEKRPHFPIMSTSPSSSETSSSSSSSSITNIYRQYSQHHESNSSNYSSSKYSQNHSSCTTSITQKPSCSNSSSSHSRDRKEHHRYLTHDRATDTSCSKFRRELTDNNLKKQFILSKLQSNHSHRSRSRSHSQSRHSHSSHNKTRKRDRSRSQENFARHCHSKSRSKGYSTDCRRARYDTSSSSSTSYNQRNNPRIAWPNNIQDSVAQRREVFVGGIPPDYKESHLRERFEKFGRIEKVQIKSKKMNDRINFFGFVTFDSQHSACEAIKFGNVCKKGEPQFELNFGGRRAFCNGEYEDLDGKIATHENFFYCLNYNSYVQEPSKTDDDDDYSRQLKAYQALRKREKDLSY